MGNLVKLDVATNYSPGAAKTTILLQATIFVSFWLQKICLTIKHNCCLSLNMQNKIPNLPQLPTIKNLHQQESSSLCLLKREEWSGLATKFCLLVIYSRPGGSHHKHGVNFWLQIFLSLSSRVQINLGRSQKLSVFLRCFQSFVYIVIQTWLFNCSAYTKTAWCTNVENKMLTFVAVSKLRCQNQQAFWILSWKSDMRRKM